MRKSLFAISAVISASAALLSAGTTYESRLLNKKINVSWKLQKLISARGQAEKYKDVNPAADKLEVSMKTNKLPEGAVEYAFKAKNNSAKPLYLRPVVTVDVPNGKLNWWNGYNYMRKLTFDPSDINLSNWFPACAAYNQTNGVVLGINPMYLYSRVDSGKLNTRKGDKLFMALPFIVEPGKDFDYSFVVSSCKTRYGYRDIVQHWYDVFPKAYNPAPGINPDVISGESSYMYWNPNTTNMKFVGDFIRRMFGGRGSWEWCYKPFVRGGDWAISDKWSVGWRGWSKERVDNWRKFIKKRLEPAEFLGVAPMWYLNISWTEWSIWKDHFPKICPEKNPRKRKCWGQETLYGVYSWGNDYAKLFAESINQIPKEYPAAKGIAWDSCFGHKIFKENVDGVKNTHHKSFMKGEMFAVEGAGIANLLDLNHKNFAGKYRMANAVNFKLVSPYMIGVRADTALYEGQPMRTSDRLLRIESMRARVGTRKALIWHKGALPSHINWIDWDDMNAEEARDVYNQLIENILFCSYYWGATSAPLMPTVGVESLFKAVPELVDLIRQGWQPSPGVDANKDLLITRYGKGTGSRVVVINPTFEPIKAKLVFRPDYWDGKALLLAREDGEIMSTIITPQGTNAELNIPERKIVILRVCGTGTLNNSVIKNLEVKSEKVSISGKIPCWKFDLKTQDKILWNVNIFRSTPGTRVKVRCENERKKFSGKEDVKMTLVSAKWRDDVQAGVRRSALLELSEYPLYSVEKITADALKKLKMLDKIKIGKLAIVVPADASQKVKDEAQRICEWFRFYTWATEKRFYEPEIVTEAPANTVAIAINTGAEGLKSWEKGKAVQKGKLLSLTARDEATLRQTVLKFLLKLDEAYPFYGKLPMEKSLIKMGLGGKTLRPAKAKEIFHPTLLEMLRKTNVIK
jgi:hypothetical protein